MAAAAKQEPKIVAIHDAVELPAKLADMIVNPKNLGKYQQELLAAMAPQILPGAIQAMYKKALLGDVKAGALVMQIFGYANNGPSTVINNINDNRQATLNNSDGGSTVYSHDAMVRAASRARSLALEPAIDIVAEES